MKLISIQYNHQNGQPDEWQLENCLLNDINLIIGKNATGKSRTIRSIVHFTQILAGEQKPINNGSYIVIFENKGIEIIYRLIIKNNQVAEEELKHGDKMLLQRDADGTGRIWATKLEDYIDFQPPIDEISVVNRRDAIQHGFFEELYQWGKTARYFLFGTAMGQNQMVVSEPDNRKMVLKDFTKVITVFKRGQDTYPKDYEQCIIKDMQKIGYEIKSIGIYSEIMEYNKNPINVDGIAVHEKDLNTITPQTQMSSGMFRALSLLIQINFSIFENLPSCILIDDIGEGLDYSRSTALIKLLISKVEGTKMQLIMSTNDQFVMDAVPLKYWLIIKRLTGKAKIYNYQNNKKLFDSFKFTGLGNFDFFSSNYYLKEE